MSVDTEHETYKEFKSIWSKCRDVVSGQEKVHSKGDLYLPKLSGQNSSEYEAYKYRALFYNATQRTVDAMVGLLFRKDPNVEVPTSVELWLDNIDMQGNSLDNFVQKLAEDVLTVGRYGVLVEHPVKTDDVVTQNDAERVGLRPFITGYSAENVVNWNTTVVNNVTLLNQVVLREYSTEPGNSDFEWNCVEKYRVLDLSLENGGRYRQRVFRAVDNGNFMLESEVFPTNNGNPFFEIPFIIISAKDCDFEVVKPPILDLVNVNVSHYVTTADLEHGAHYTGLPTVVVTGHSKGENESFKIGSTSAWVFAEEEADVKYLEFTGQGLEALEKRTASKERQMATLGARLLAEDKAAAETAEAHNIKRQGENSALSAVGQSISSGVTQALRILSEWSGVDGGEIEYSINDDFTPDSMDSTMLVALLQTWQSGGMSYVEFIRNLKRGELISADKSAGDVKDEIELEGPIITNTVDEGF